MTESFERDGLGAVPERAAEAAVALEGLREPADRAANAIGEAFDRAGESLARSLARAAADGEVSLAELARAVLAAVNTGAGGAKGSGLGPALAAALGGLFGGARAEGGPVSAGAAYLVGERGPEVFRPAGSGTIDAVTGPVVTINVSVDGGAPALLRSEAQIAGMLARAVALGARRL